MAKYLVIGGGLAGISAAVFLKESGHEVELIEASPKLGGRSYSFYSNKFKSEIDNGQHIFMGSYQHTFDFLKIVSAENLPEYQSHLRIKFLERGGKEHLLDSRSSFYPINLLFALNDYSVLSWKDKLSIVKLMLKILLVNEENSTETTAKKWLDENKIVILDRYYTSNLIHQTPKIEESQIDEFINWLEKLEFEIFKIPRPDLVIYLHFPRDGAAL